MVALAQHGVANSVATLGTASGEALSKNFIVMLMRWSVALMATKLGVRLRGGAGKCIADLNEHRLIKVVVLPDGEDPGQSDPQSG